MYYRDDGTEGRDSCFKVYSLVSAYPDAVQVCANAAAGAHLITFRGFTKSKGLFYSVLSTIQGRTNKLWAGCTQLSPAITRSQGWSWVDGTPSNNLNCGGLFPCDTYLWQLGAPDDDGCGGTESGCENYCAISSAFLEDVSPRDGLFPLCEYDVPTGQWLRSSLLIAGCVLACV